MKRTVWTMMTVVLLAQFAAKIGLTHLGFGPSAGPAAMVFSVLLYSTLAVVTWMQTPWGALLVVGIGTLIFVSNLIYAALNLYPQFGTQVEQYIYTPLNLAVPLFAFLSYRSITRQA